MNYHRGTLVGGDFTVGQDPKWKWVRNGGGYQEGRDFLCVHWEVQQRDPDSIRLHVEAPSASVDPTLNSIKQRVVAALLSTDIDAVARRSGYSYRCGVKVSVEAIQANKSTEAFRLIVDAGQRRVTSEQNIEAVHRIFGSHVGRVLGQFSSDIARAFP